MSHSDAIARVAIDFYENKLSRKGKPSEEKNEWTALSAFILEDLQGKLTLLALGTGTKCLGEVETSKVGDLVHDSHAEIIAKRSLVRLLIHDAQKCLANDKSLCLDNDGKNKVKLKEGHKIHFYTSHPPCGDATIAPMEESESKAKKPRLDVDIHRTGAKSGLDVKGQGQDFHVVGAVRTKPGRGEPTLSLSCSDKLAKWCQVGLQGCLLSSLFEKPLLPSSVIVGSKQFNKESLKRALFERFSLNQNEIKIEATKEPFGHEKQDEKSACDASIYWNAGGYHGAVVKGRKLGCIKKHFGTPKAESDLCRKRIAHLFLQLLSPYLSFDQEVGTYSELKNKTRAPFYEFDKYFCEHRNLPENHQQKNNFNI